MEYIYQNRNSSNAHKLFRSRFETLDGDAIGQLVKHSIIMHYCTTWPSFKLIKFRGELLVSQFSYFSYCHKYGIEKASIVEYLYCVYIC